MEYFSSKILRHDITFAGTSHLYYDSHLTDNKNIGNKELSRNFDVVKTFWVQLNYQNETPNLGEGQQVDQTNFSYLG